MPILEFVDQSYSRPGYRVPASLMQNMYDEATPNGPGTNARYPRPTLTTSYTIGTGPIKGVFSHSGVINGEKYAVSGTGWYKDSTLLMSVADGALARFAGSSSELGLVIGGDLYRYTGVSAAQVLYFKEYATGTLTLSGTPTAGQTVTVGLITYTWRASVSTTANEVKIGANATEALVNLTAAVNLGTGAGTLYGSLTTINTKASASNATATTLLFTAKAYGTIGENVVVTTETMANGAFSPVGQLGNLSVLPQFSSITFAGGRFYLTVLNSDRFYWSDIDNLVLIDPLSFATAESDPDKIVDVATLGDEVWFFGGESVEPWYQTGQADTPVQRSQGRRYEKGCAAQGTVAALDNALFFVGNDHLVYRTSNVPMRVSTYSIEAAIERCEDISLATAYALWFGGHTFYVLNIPGVSTYAYDVSNGKWAEWTSYGKDNFIPSCAMIIGDQIYLGSSLDGKVYSFATGTEQDDGETVTYAASAFLFVPSTNKINFSLMLQCTRGLGSPTGVTNPVVEMRYSDNSGQTWSLWRKASLGMQGQYNFKAIWRRLGQLTSPGRLYEFRTTDAVPIVYEYVVYNEGTP